MSEAKRIVFLMATEEDRLRPFTVLDMESAYQDGLRDGLSQSTAGWAGERLLLLALVEQQKKNNKGFEHAIRVLTQQKESWRKRWCWAFGMFLGHVALDILIAIVLWLLTH
jgi:hypothetical protein